MVQPRLTFFSELEPGPLQRLLADPAVTAELNCLKAGVSLGLLDLSAERAEAVRFLNRAGIPVIAWQLLPKEQGYWFNIGNVTQAVQRYEAFRRWTAEYDLRWDGVGLDIETDIREMQGVLEDRARLLPVLLKRVLDSGQLRGAQRDYAALVARIRADGYRVDSYQMPFIVDERRIGSTVLQKLFAVVDLAVDREVLMLYSSFYRPYGAAVLWSYGRDAQSVGIGVTGGGVDIPGVTPPRFLDWDEFARDLTLALHWTHDIHIFSLEGCVQQGFLSRLRDFDWGRLPTLPVPRLKEIECLRRTLRGALWASAHPGIVLLAGLFVLRLLDCRRRRRR